jgi:GNAT superfamily N-acetyltransferase
VNICLRRSSECDSGFLFQLFGEIKKAELHFDLFPEIFPPGILQMQYNAWEEMVRTRYSRSDDFIIMLDSERAGRLQFLQSAKEIRIINISVLPIFQGKGIGTTILQRLLFDADSKGLEVTLEFDRTNRAATLYKRLGFVEYQSNELKIQMGYPKS